MLNEVIDGLSSMVVDKYVNDGVPLNDSVLKIAQEKGFNGNQIARLVESSNKKAFLRLFPEKHSFEVADVSVVNDKLKKSCKTTTKSAGVAAFSRDNVNYNLMNLYKDDTPPTKSAGTARHANKHAVHTMISKIKRASEEIDYEIRCKKSDAIGCETKLIDLTKQSLMRGVRFSELESHVIALSPEKRDKLACVLDRIYERVKDLKFIDKVAFERGYIAGAYGKSSVFTDIANNIVKNAEEIPILERARTILNDKLIKLRSEV